MQIHIRSRQGSLSPARRRTLERRLRLTLGRKAGAVARADVELTPDRDEVGHPTSVCRLRLESVGGARLQTTERAASSLEATAAAIWRLSHRLEALSAAPLHGARESSLAPPDFRDAG